MPHTRIALSFVTMLLGASALTAPAHAGWLDFSSSKSDADKPAAKTDKKTADTSQASPSQDLDGAIRQAQLLRTDGHYDEAIKQLSQIMIVASDDPRVVGEYGKTLAAMGRASEAIDFLTRAQQLAPGDWMIYSALGVAYDQTGNQTKAANAYEQALVLKPGEASVLNNYALSRMLAKDPQGAQRLIARAELAGGSTDPKIARNITMMKDLAAKDAEAVAANTPAPRAVAMQVPPQTAFGPTPAPRVAVTSHPMPQVAQAQPTVNLPEPRAINTMPSGAPRPLVAPNAGAIPAQPQQVLPVQVPSAAAPEARDNRVVMQRVPFDPLAGPVPPRHVAAATPAPSKASAAKLQPKQVSTESAPVKAAAQTPAGQANDLEAKAEAIAKQLVNRPAAQAQAIAQASKPVAPQSAPAPKPIVKAAEAAPKAPVKMADAKPAPKAVPVKTTTKDVVPALRVSASAY